MEKQQCIKLLLSTWTEMLCEESYYQGQKKSQYSFRRDWYCVCPCSALIVFSSTLRAKIPFADVKWLDPIQTLAHLAHKAIASWSTGDLFHSSPWVQLLQNLESALQKMRSEYREIALNEHINSSGTWHDICYFFIKGNFFLWLGARAIF